MLSLLMEFGVRAITNRWAPKLQERAVFWRYDPLLGWSHRPGQKGFLHHRDFTIKVAINSQGLRDVEYPVERTVKKRMLLLGDSFGWGFGVEQHECMSEIIEKEHPDWEVINASVSGYSTDQEYLYLKERGKVFRPDIVLLLFTENDFFDNNRGSASWYFKPYFIEQNGVWMHGNNPVPRATIKQRTDRFFLGRTYILKYIYVGVIRGVGYLSLLTKHNHQRDVSLSDQKYEKTFAVTGHLLQSINKVCIENHAEFILVSVPMERIKRAWMLDFTQKEKIPYLALDPYFESKEKQTTFAHDKHWNSSGHQIAANAISDFLHKLKIF